MSRLVFQERRHQQRSVWLFGIIVFISLCMFGEINSDSSADKSIGSTKNNNTSSSNTRNMGADKPIDCYVCSWSVTANLTTNNDHCSSYKFVPEAATTAGCDYGCQTVSYRTTKKEDARHFHRNCLKKQPGQELKERCVTTYSKVYGYEELCECITNLCNGAPRISGFSLAQLSQKVTLLAFTTTICGIGSYWLLTSRC